MPDSNPIESQGAAAGRAKETPAPVVPTVMPQCPNCGWHDVRFSMTRGALDHALSTFLLTPFRCRTCGHRFYRFFKRTSAS